MAHAQRLEVEVKMLRSKNKQLEEAFANARASGSRDETDIFSPSSPTMPGAFEDVEEVAESIGSFSIGSDGAGKYHGRFAGSEYLSRLVWSDEDKHEIRPLKSLRSQLLRLSPDIAELATAAPYGIKGCEYEKSIFLPYIPPYQRAERLVRLYYEKAAWMYRPILRPEFDNAILNVLYDRDGYPSVNSLHPHRISTFFIALALGANYEHGGVGGESDSETYNLLALAALSLSSIINEVNCAALQALFLIIQYHYFTDPGTDETRWLLFGALCRAAQVIGLQRDSAPWNLDPSEVQRRRTLFWEMYTWDSWASFVNARPGAFRLEDTDCKFPDDDGFVRPDGQVEYSYHGWKFRYSATCLAPTVKFASSLKTPGYSQFLELDRRIRTFPLPSHLQSPLDESPEGWADDPSLAMQQYGVVCERESNLLYLHRAYFVKAIRHPSKNPLGHKYSPSVLAAYRSARRLISSLRGVYAKHPQLTATIWFFWSAVFSACYILGGIVVESPGCPLAPAALAELERAITFYEEGSTTRIPSTTTMLERLRDRAKIAFEQFQSGHGPQPPVDESEFPDDVAIISGRASVINRAGSSQSPNSARLSESPQSTPAGISGVTTSPITSPVASDARVYNVHGNVNMSMGGVTPDFGLDYYNPNHNPSHPQQHPQYINGTNDVNGVGGMGNLGGTGVNGISGMNMNGINGGMSHGSGGMLPPPPPHLGMDQVYGDPNLQQLYTMDLDYPYHQQDYGHSQVAALPLHGPGGSEDTWANFMQHLTTDGGPHQNGYQPQMGHLA